jgi:hypothetical protein
MTRKQTWLLIGIGVGLAWYYLYPKLAAARRLAQPVQTPEQAAAVASSAPPTYNF